MRKARSVAHRLLALNTVRFRLQLESADVDAASMARAQEAVAQRLNVDIPPTAVTAQEHAWARAPIGSLAWHDHLNISWLLECQIVLGWTLGLCDLPSHDEQARPSALHAAIPLPGRPVDALLGAKFAQPKGDIADADARYYTLLWRLRSTPEKGARVLSPAIRDSVRESGLPLVDGDVSLRGRAAFRYLRTDDVWRECHSIVLERSRAFRWLSATCAWDEVNLDT